LAPLLHYCQPLWPFPDHLLWRVHSLHLATCYLCTFRPLPDYLKQIRPPCRWDLHAKIRLVYCCCKFVDYVSPEGYGTSMMSKVMSSALIVTPWPKVTFILALPTASIFSR
jgi:hypothetical protein